MSEAKQDEECEEFQHGWVLCSRSSAGWSDNQRRSTDRNKPDPSHPSQGPLSSIKAAFKRTSTKSQGDSGKEKRRPDITIVSVETVPATSWFGGCSGKFPARPASSQTVWDGGVHTSGQPPPSYDQVIKEKTREKDPTPTAPPRRSYTSSIATQTEEDGNTHTEDENRSGEPSEKPRKPPRSSLPHKIPDPYSNKTANQSPPQSISDRSALVSVENPKPHGAQPEPSERPSLHPIPYPRSKIKQPIKDRDVVPVKENEPPLSGKQLKELLEVFDPLDPARTRENQPEEDLTESMAALHSERNIQARIKEFEKQMNAEEFALPSPQPRTVYTPKPAVAPRPSVPSRLPFSAAQEETNPQTPGDGNYIEQFLDNFTDPTRTPPSSAPKPLPPRKPSLNTSDRLKPQLPIKSVPSLPSRPSLRRSNPVNSHDGDDIFDSVPFSPSMASKELLNFNNHNNIQNELMDDLASHAPSTVPSGAAGFANTVTRKPTIIRVPSKKEEEASFPSALPVQRAVGGSLRALPSIQRKESYSSGRDPSLPPRPSGGKVLPPRPPSAKSSPGRPPPPRRDSVQRNAPVQPVQTRNRHSLSRTASKKAPVLPSRPNPGHRLYNKYTLEIPHGIAEFDYNSMQPGELSFQRNEVLVLLNQIDSKTFECQVGDAKGTVQKTHMKIITPLSHYSYHEAEAEPPERSHQDFGYSAQSQNLRVQALYNFAPEGPGELGLKAGDIITNVEQLDSEWYLGTSKGLTGFFPINYVKLLPDSPAPKKAPAPIRPPPKPVTQRVSEPRCMARFDFEGESGDELSFNEGEVIRLLEYLGDDWARGEIGGHVGIFPLNFVEVIEDLPASSQWNQGSIALPGMAAPYNTPAAASASNQAERVVALYDFTAETSGDLPFLRGDVIEVIEHIDEEWSRGKLKGREGIFPRSFTQTHTGGFPLR